MQELAGTPRKRGGSRLDPTRPPLTNTERSRRFRARHPKPPRPPKPDLFPGLKTFEELVAGLEQPPERPPALRPRGVGPGQV